MITYFIERLTMNQSKEQFKVEWFLKNILIGLIPLFIKLFVIFISHATFKITTVFNDLVIAGLILNIITMNKILISENLQKTIKTSISMFSYLNFSLFSIIYGLSIFISQNKTDKMDFIVFIVVICLCIISVYISYQINELIYKEKIKSKEIDRINMSKAINKEIKRQVNKN